MNNHHTDAAAADAACTRVFLQQAVDHYPRLVAFSFTLVLPYRETMADYRSLILRFHTEVWLRIGEYSWQRRQERRSSPPTLLRWLWESACAPECKMLLMMNLDTLGAVREEGTLQMMSEIIRNAWLAVSGTACNTVTNISPVILNRSGRGTFTTSFNQLKAQVQTMLAPVSTSRTGVTS